MKINSNDIFNKIGLILSPPSNEVTFVNHQRYIASLQIQLGDDQTYLLQVKQSDDPHKLAIQFCKKHSLNHLAVTIVEQKIRQAKEHEQQKQKSKPKSRKKEKKVNFEEIHTIVTPPKYKKKQIQPSNDLYVRSVVRSKYHEEERKKRKLEQDRKEGEQLTFKPKINHVSEKIVEFLRNENVKKVKRKQSPQNKLYDQLKDCTFQPKINKVSNMIVNNRSLRREEIENFREMYESNEKQEKSKSVKKKKKSTDDKHYFKPQINEKSKQITVPFFKRLQMEMEKKKCNNKSHYDQEECSFQPKIGRPPKVVRKKQNEPVWQHLHRFNSKKDLKKHICTTNGAEQSNKTHSQMAYYNNLIQSRIREVFYALDSDVDGLISPEEIGVENLSPNTLLFLKPIFLEMDELEATLNYYDFNKAVHALMADSDPGKKGSFLSEKWWKSNGDDEKFIPSINPRSKQLAANRSVNNLYEQGLAEMRNREYKLEKEKAMKQERELAQCSFKPALNNSSKYYLKKILSKKELKKNITNNSYSQLF